jgi:hypothetical protein
MMSTLPVVIASGARFATPMLSFAVRHRPDQGHHAVTENEQHRQTIGAMSDSDP